MNEQDRTEGHLTQKLGAALNLLTPSGIYLKHSDGKTSGIPDFTWTWHGFTSWHEVKYANPQFKSVGLQELTCCRLAMHGICDYIIYDESSKDIIVVEPKSLGDWQRSVVRFPKFNHAAVAGYIRQLHENRVNQ